MDNTTLDSLFSAAKNAAPEIAFESTQTAFVASLAAAGSASLWMKIVNSFKNPFIMISTTGIIIATLTLTVFNSSEPMAIKTRTAEPKAQTEQTNLMPSVSQQESLGQIAMAEAELDDSTHKSLESRVGEVPNQTAGLPQNSFTSFNSAVESLEATGYNKEADEEETQEYVYFISHATSENEFLAIKSQAEKAGIDFTFKMKKDVLKRLKMEIKSGDNAQFRSLRFSGEFESTVGWVTNENGEFISFYESDESIYYEALDNALDELEHVFEDLSLSLDNMISDEEKRQNAQIDLEVIKGETVTKIMELDPLSAENPIKTLESIVLDSDTITAEQVAAIETVYEIQQEEDGLETIISDVSESTTEAELKAIQERAIKAGITMSMEYKYKKGVLTKLDIGMRVKSNGKNKFSSIYIKAGKRSMWNSQIIWRVDENGKAIDFDDNRCQMIKIK